MNDQKLERAVELMVHTSHTHKMLLDSRLKETGLYGTQHRILMHLARHGYLSSQKDLVMGMKYFLLNPDSLEF